jgi:hypothetical protein
MEFRSIMINKRRANLLRGGTESQGFWEKRDPNAGRDPGKTVWKILSDFTIEGPLSG